jgi:hypothetical protein
MVQGEQGAKEDRKMYEMYVKPYGLSRKKMTELDALEAYYPGGLAEFVKEPLSRYEDASKLDDETWLLDLKKGVLPFEKDIDSIEAVEPT